MPTEEQIDKIFRQASELFKRKLNDYGIQDIIEMGDNDMERMQTILQTRINEKRLRALNVVKNPQSRLQEESLLDSFLDMIGYSVILALLCRGEWEGIRVPSDIKECKEDTLLLQRSVSAKVHPIPSPKKQGDVGHDLYTVEDTVIPHSLLAPTDVPTGIRIKIPEGYWAMVINRSSTARKLGIDVVNGVIDTGYTGELFACCWNRTGRDITIPKGARLAQFVIFKSIVPTLKEVTKLPETERGESGFGSTGLQ